MGIVIIEEPELKVWLVTELMDETLKDIMPQLNQHHKINALKNVATAMYVHLMWY